MALPADLSNVPFSARGAWMSIGQPPADQLDQAGLAHGLWLRNLHGDGVREVLHLRAFRLDDEEKRLEPEIHADPGQLQLVLPTGRVRFCFQDDETIRIRLEGDAGLRLHMRPGAFHCAVPLDAGPRGRWLLNAAAAARDYTLVPVDLPAEDRLPNAFEVDAPWWIARCEYVLVTLRSTTEASTEVALHQTRGRTPLNDPYPAFDIVVDRVQDDFHDYASRCPAAPPEYADAARLAACINWSSLVAPAGQFRRPAMLMSNNWMTNVWSWDHCFNAMALAAGDPELAWDQFMIPFDFQTEHGQIPDLMNDGHQLYNFTKPPVHGWAFRWMMRQHPSLRQRDRLAELYPKLAAFTRWWYDHRDPDGDALPRYHHGNDSGWDNGSVFDVGLPVKGPDLAACLVEQADLLEELARTLGHDDDAAEWVERRDRTFHAMLDRLWTGDRFVTRHALTGEVNADSRSIIPATTIILGKRLPEHVRDALARQIASHLTDWGVATEHPESSLYEPDGYWRGPIWAPTTLMLSLGLEDAGEHQLARTIAQRFVRLGAESGFAENYDARSGQPLRDKAYTWTASAWLILAQRFAIDRTLADGHGVGG